MVTVEARAAYSIQPHALDDSADALGMMTLIPIYQGEQVTDAKLARPDEANALSMKTPQGKRAVTIGVDAISGVSGLIKPSDYVDVMGVFSVPGGGGGVVTLTILQRLEVLAVGSQLSSVSDDEEGGGDGTITLALTPQEAQLLMFARAAQAQLQLALRTKTDTVALADLTPTTQDTLMAIILGPKALELLKQPEIAKAPEKTVEIFRGLKKEVVALPAEAP
jgi:pilus assembly protein CpaB